MKYVAGMTEEGWPVVIDQTDVLDRVLFDSTPEDPKPEIGSREHEEARVECAVLAEMLSAAFDAGVRSVTNTQKEGCND